MMNIRKKYNSKERHKIRKEWISDKNTQFILLIQDNLIPSDSKILVLIIINKLAKTEYHSWTSEGWNQAFSNWNAPYHRQDSSGIQIMLETDADWNVTWLSSYKSTEMK